MSSPAVCPRCAAPRTSEGRFCQRCGFCFTDAVSDPLLGAQLLGRYRVVRQLGEGTMGKVYLGEQRVGEATRNVAIKVLAATRGNDDYIVARFRREASTVASLEHPNIIRLYDYGEEDGRFFSVMEFVPGGSLAALMARGRLAPARVEGIAWQVASALDAAHQRGVVHRDLKPENVLLASTQDAPGGRDVVKVVDFGIARRPPTTPGERPLTITGAMLGTPAYMSPEQFMGETADARADVYALGLLVYQMLSGTLPWTATSVMEWGDAHMRQAPRPLRTIPGCADLPERYDLALSRALAKEARHRTAGALDFVRELTGRSEPTSSVELRVTAPVVPGAAPVTAPVEPDLRAVVRPSRGPLAIGLAVGVLLLGLGAWWAYGRLSSAEAPTVPATDAATQGTPPPAQVAHDAATRPPDGARPPAPTTRPASPTDAGAARPHRRPTSRRAR